MVAPTIIAWFGNGVVPAVLLALGGAVQLMGNKLGFLEGKLWGGVTWGKIVGVASVLAAVALFMK